MVSSAKDLGLNSLTPSQPVLSSAELSVSQHRDGAAFRQFKTSWYQKYPWLEYPWLEISRIAKIRWREGSRIRWGEGSRLIGILIGKFYSFGSLPKIIPFRWGSIKFRWLNRRR